MLNVPKPSRKHIVVGLTAFLILDIVILSYFQVLNSFLDVPQTVTAHLQLMTFINKAEVLFEQVKSNKRRFWQAYSDLSHILVKVKASDILAAPGSEGPSTIFYDPRLTIATYMDELQRLGETDELPILPFHWVDWANVDLDGTKVGFEQSLKATCARLKNRIRGRPNTQSFCKNKYDLSDAEVEAFGFRNREQLPQAIIYDHCGHDKLSFNGIRAFMAKLYTMTYLPKPLKVVILNDVEIGGTYEFMVNQTRSSDQRLLYSGMIERFIKRTTGKSAASLLKWDGSFKVNHLKVFESLRNTVKPRLLSSEEDVMDMHKIVRSPPGSDKRITLKEHHFHYPHERIQEQIDKYEKIEHKDVQEENYLSGLKDCINYDGKNEPTYFKLATLDTLEQKNSINDWGWHYDWRFFSDALFYLKDGWSKAERVERTNIILERLLRNWSRFAEEKGIVTWIMHGPLLSWYWDGLMFPFDVDIDIQMPISELIRLSQNYNQTLVVENPSEGYGRFLIDVGTYIHNRGESETGNHIDARFVDVDLGIYIDITALAKSRFDLPDDYKKQPIVVKEKGDYDAEVYNDRRKHFYTLPQLGPLSYSMMGGVPVYVPNQIEARLRWEYSKGLDDYEFNSWYFVPKLQLWIMKEKILTVFRSNEFTRHGQFDKDKLISRIRRMSDEEGLKLLEDDEILAQYYMTHKLTDWHDVEKNFLFGTKSKDNLEALQNDEIRGQYNKHVGKVKFSKPLRKCFFEYETFDRPQHHSD